VLSDLLYRLQALLRRGTVEAELDDEICFHLDREAQKYRQSGIPEHEAARRARLAFGGKAQIQEECRDARGTRCLEECVQDLRYAFRVARKSPVFLITVVLTIAIGIGASTAIFSVTSAVLLRRFPTNDPEQLVLVFWENRQAYGKSFLHSNADFIDLRNGAAAIFEGVGGVASFRAFVSHADGSTTTPRIET